MGMFNEGFMGGYSESTAYTPRERGCGPAMPSGYIPSEEVESPLSVYGLDRLYYWEGCFHLDTNASACVKVDGSARWKGRPDFELGDDAKALVAKVTEVSDTTTDLVGELMDECNLPSNLELTQEFVEELLLRVAAARDVNPTDCRMYNSRGFKKSTEEFEVKCFKILRDALGL